MTESPVKRSGSPESTRQKMGRLKRAVTEILRFAWGSQTQEFEKCGFAEQDMELAPLFCKEFSQPSHPGTNEA